MNWKPAGKIVAAVVAVLVIGWLVFRMGDLAASDAKQVTKDELKAALGKTQAQLRGERRARMELQAQIIALGEKPNVNGQLIRFVPVPGRDGRDGEDGKDGHDGRDAPPVTFAQIMAAVAAYCDSHNQCEGPPGKDGKDADPPPDPEPDPSPTPDGDRPD